MSPAWMPSSMILDMMKGRATSIATSPMVPRTAPAETQPYPSVLLSSAPTTGMHLLGRCGHSFVSTGIVLPGRAITYMDMYYY